MIKFFVSFRKYLQNHDRTVMGVAIALSFLTISLGVYWFLPLGVDWRNTYRPAALQVLAFQSPYNVKIYHSPPWSVLPILPLAILPESVGYAINFSWSLAVTAFVAHRLGAKPISIGALLFSYPILFMAGYGQIDWLIYLGFILPPTWGLFFVLIKPQISIGIIIYWLIQAFREGGVKKVAFTFLPVSTALLLSFVVFGNWFQSGFSEIGKSFNASLWPQSIPIGLAILIRAIRQQKANNAILSSPMLAPYLAPHGWGVALLGLSPSVVELIVASVSIWVLRFMTGNFLR